MLFNSIHFFIFLPIVFTLYWVLNKRGVRIQNVLLLLASYFFYACWDWRFLFLLLFSTVLDYFSGLMMYRAANKSKKKFWFWLSIIINLGFLGIFKYYNFFANSLIEAFSSVGLHASLWSISIILPVGISFYTFHGLSYVIDIYKNKIVPEKNIITYSLFVSYFPLLVAGPIERATHLLPQLKRKRTFNYSQAVNGIKQILLGLFKKIVVADNCAFFVNQIFDNISSHTASELWIAMVLFSFQIYGDFSGYSDIALGISKLFGIELLQNFKFPYFARDIADFWRRWHVSLSGWFRDYVYIPLGGSQTSLAKQIRNVFIIFILSGFWHGANWKFIFWGILHALLFLPLLISKQNRQSLNNSPVTFVTYFKIALTFVIVSFAWIFFRANSMADAFLFITNMFNFGSGAPKYFYSTTKLLLLFCISCIAIVYLVYMEWKNFIKGNQEVQLNKFTVFLLLLFLMCMGTYQNPISFIYFQF